jgi:hypothetical protein
MCPRLLGLLLVGTAAWPCPAQAGPPPPTRTDALVANTRSVVAAVVEAGRRNRNAGAPRKGDELTAHYFRAAAAAARKLPADQAAPAYLFGLGVALDTADMLRTNVLTRGIWRRVESERERKARLAVLGTPTVHGRHDLCQHFVVSCALAAVGGPEAAEAAGLLKEVLDSRPGGSGFSFADLSADMAGVAFAKQLLASPALLERVERSFTVADYALPPAGLVEGLTEAEFVKRYGGTDDERFLKAQEALRRRVLALPGYKPSAAKPKQACCGRAAGRIHWGGRLATS